MIRIEKLRFQYPQGPFVLRIPSLSVGQGEKVGIIGPSGSGKSTLVHLISGILVPQAGSARVAGVDLTGCTDAQQRDFRISHIGFVFQEFGLLEYLTVRENILLPHYINPSLPLDASVGKRAESLGAALHLADDLSRLPGQLSHGERQRVAIARALITQPPLLIADEPTGNLDPDTAAATLSLLIDQVEQHGMTMLMVTHNHALLEALDRVIDVTTFGSGGAS